MFTAETAATSIAELLSPRVNAFRLYPRLHPPSRVAGEKREGRKNKEKERSESCVSLRSRSHSHDNGAPAEPVALYCFTGSRSLNDAYFST